MIRFLALVFIIAVVVALAPVWGVACCLAYLIARRKDWM